MGFQIAATPGTAERLRDHGVSVETILKVSEGRPNVVDHIKNGDIQLVINVSLGRRSSQDAYHIRRGALQYNVPYSTTLSGARATAMAIHALRKEPWNVTPLQAYHRDHH
jgi:carbamoyl-phosphate synthase large subunit